MTTRDTTRTTPSRKPAAPKTKTTSASTTKKPAPRTNAAKKPTATRQKTSSTTTPKPSSNTTKKPAATRKTTTPTVPPGATPPPATQAEAVSPMIPAPTPRKSKIVRDSFSLPKAEHKNIKKLRAALKKSGRKTSKSEVLRAALDLLLSHDTADIITRLDALPKVVKGRGKKSSKSTKKKK